MPELSETPGKNPVVYVTRDIERALPIRHQKSYCIITNATEFAKGLAKNDKNIVLIDQGAILDTRELLGSLETKQHLATLKNPAIVVFKNTPQIEKTCRSNGWKLLNPSAELASRVEEKISQVAWLGSLSKKLPDHKIVNGSELAWSGKSFIVQFNRAHTGSGTLLVASEADVLTLKTKFPERPLRVSDLISGPVFTSNNIVAGDKILEGPIMYQITGISPFTENAFATIGNDWELPKKLLTPNQASSFHELAVEVGEKLRQSGWKGLFGIDVIMDEASGKLYLLEINARQPASTSFESELQGKGGCTTFAAHLAALLNTEQCTDLLPVEHGAQIILRAPKIGLIDSESIAAELERAGFNVIDYGKAEPEKDLLRIQSKKGIMDAHNQLNELGLTIRKIIEKYVR